MKSTLSIPLAGAQHHELCSIEDQVKQLDKLSLIPEPDNPYDGLAIKVLHNNVMIGYIPKKWCATVHETMKKDYHAFVQRYDPQEISYKQLTIGIDTTL